MVEQRPFKSLVQGSSPCRPTSLRRAYGWQAIRCPTTAVAGTRTLGRPCGEGCRAEGLVKAGMTPTGCRWAEGGTHPDWG